MRSLGALMAAALLAMAGCAAPVPVVTEPVAAPSRNAPSTPRSRAEMAALNFVTVVERVEPVAERNCRALTRGVPCDFTIVVDDRPAKKAMADIRPNARLFHMFLFVLLY